MVYYQPILNDLPGNFNAAFVKQIRLFNKY